MCSDWSPFSDEVFHFFHLFWLLCSEELFSKLHIGIFEISFQDLKFNNSYDSAPIWCAG